MAAGAQQYPMGYAELVPTGAIPGPLQPNPAQPVPPAAPQQAPPSVPQQAPQEAQDPVPQGQPRPEGPTGFYQAPNPQTLGGLIKQGMTWIQDRVTGRGAQTEGAVPTPGEPDGAQTAQRAFASNTIAATPAEMRQVYKSVDPEGKLSPQELQLKTMQDMADYWISHGRPDRAASAVAAVMLYGKKVAATAGMAAMAAIRDGDLQRAAQWLQKGYGYIPDGKSVRFEPDAEGRITYWFIDGNGQPLSEKQIAGPEEMTSLATAMANGSGWMQSMMDAIYGPGRGGRGTGERGPTQGQINAQEVQAALGEVNSAGNRLREAQASGDESKIAEATEAFRTSVEGAMVRSRNPNLVRQLAAQFLPKEYGAGRGKKPTPEESFEEKADAAETAFSKHLETVQDPAERQKLELAQPFIRPDIAYDLQKSDDSIDEAGLDRLLGPDATGEYSTLDPKVQQTLRFAAEKILRKTPGSAQTVVAALDAFRRGQAQLTPMRDGRVQIGNFGAYYIPWHAIRTLLSIREPGAQAAPQTAPQAAP